MTVAEVSKLLKVTRFTLCRWITDGHLKAEKVKMLTPPYWRYEIKPIDLARHRLGDELFEMVKEAI